MRPRRGERRNTEGMTMFCRYVLGCGLLVGVLTGPLLASGESAGGPAALSDDRLIVEGLAAGLDVAPLLAEVRDRAPAGFRARRPVLPPATTEAAELNGALAGMARALAATRDDGGRGEPASRSLLGAFDRLRAADLLYRARFAAAGKRLDEIGASGEIHERLVAAEEAYTTSMAAVLERLGAPMEALRKAFAEGAGSSETAVRQHTGAAVTGMSPAIEEAAAALAALPAAPQPEILRAAILPYGRLSLGRRDPATTPTVLPSYLDPTDVSAAPADLAPSALTSFSEAILQKAEELDYDYVRIFELVRNGIETEWYAGAMKGAEETLRQGRGSDVDQATLLVALLRAAGAPARFVTGVVELPVAAVADDLGLSAADPDLAGRVAEALRRAGVAHRPVTRGGRVAAFEVEHVWVSARIPYANYRGAVVDASGATWIPLAPAIEGYRVEPAAGALAAMAAAGEPSIGGLVDTVLAAPQALDPLSLLRTRVSDYLAGVGGGTYEEALRERTLEPQVLGLLPSSLPFRVVAVTGESTELPAALVHQVRFVVTETTATDAPTVLDWTVPLAELSGRRVTLSYLPATVDDHRTVNAFGGLHSVPLYLVRLRPQVKVDGRARVVSEESVAAGASHRLEVRLVTPFGEEPVARSLVAGGYYALGLGAQRGVLREVPAGDLADTESLGAGLLARVAGSYAQAWGAAEDELADLIGAAVVRPLASVVVAAGAVSIETVLGLPEQLRWDGVTLDAALRVAEPVAGATAAGPPAAGAAADWLTLAALQGSALEHRLFQELFLVDGISADKGLGLARQGGIEVVTITAANLADELGRSQHPPSVESEIENLVRLGFSVEVPRTPLVRNAWRGSVWRVVDPQGGGAGYFIAGGLAGGATTPAPGDWVLQFLADALAAPYAPEAADDPLAGVEVVKISATDRQEGTVGKPYPTALAVLVRDETGRPVHGAPVTFAVWAGGGSLIGAEGGERPSVATTTNALGMASASFRAGTSTAAEPVYVQRSENDEFATRSLADTVEVTVDTHRGPIAPDAPFELLAHPGPPAELRRTHPTVEPHLGLPAMWAGDLQVAVEDEHDNPVSNVVVTFAVGERLFEPSCPPPAEFLPAVVFAECAATVPRLGDCGSSSVVVRSSAFGASAGVILGDTVLTAHTITAAVEGLPPVQQRYLAQTFIAVPPHHCKTFPGTLHAEVVFPIDQEGNNISAARAGRAMSSPIDLRLYYARPKSEDPQSPEYSRVEWVPTSGDVSLSVDNGGSASPVASVGEGRYQSTVTTGPAPAANTVTLQATNVHTITLDEQGRVVPTTADMEPRPVTRVWGVLPQVVGTVPDPPVLGPSGQTTAELKIGYEIEPAEYRSSLAEILLYEDGELRGTSVGTARQGAGAATVQRGFPFDVEHDYELEVALNRGSSVEVRSDRFRLPLRQKILRNVSPRVQLDQDVDLLNQRACSVGAELSYTLTQPARVTLELRPIESVEIDGSLDLGNPIVLIDDKERGEGDQSRLILPGELPAGDYEFTLRAVSLVDGQVDEEKGAARSELRVRDALPVGHTIVHGIDLWDGHLVVSREDLAYPGRGMSLAFERTYSSNAGFEPGALGVGWSHSYESRAIVTPCGEVILTGAEGSGMRFVADGTGGLRPLKGYHGTLIANEAEHAFDFFTKAGNHYRYGLAHDRQFLLQWIADPNGNTTRLVYDTGLDGAPRLVAVVDPAGRKLTFHYRTATFALWGGEVLVRVDGPEGGGQSVAFNYDGFGNLVRAEREGAPSPSRAETYAYAIRAGDAIEDRHAMVSATRVLNGATTSYDFDRAAIRATANVVVPSLFYRGVTLPEGGTTTFAYDLEALESRGPPELVTRVTDRRGKTTIYHLSQYGSPLRIVDPLGHATTMTWAAGDVVMTSRTDANDFTTTFDHDEHGNLLVEAVTFDEPGGGPVTLTRQYAYHPPAAFDPPYVKDRVATRTDRTGATTTWTYDRRGNLLEQRTPVSDVDGGTTEVVTTHTYTTRGDRASSTDGRGEVTLFTYDAYGNLATVTDPEGGKTSTVFDVRGLPIHQTDPLGLLTVLEHDSLGRLRRRELPQAAGEPAPPEETWVHDDAANRVTATDAGGRVTVTTRDREGRVVSIDNAAGGTKLFDYDAEGNKVLETSWHDGATPRVDTDFSYDDAGRLLERREALGRTTGYVHDPVGNLLRETLFDREDGAFPPRVTEHVYDGLNRRVETRRLTAGDPVVTRMAYDGEGRPVRQEDALRRVTTSVYDQLGRLLRVSGPEGAETVDVYDGAGNRIEQRRRNEVDGAPADQVRTFAYDGTGRLVGSVDALDHSALFEYDLAGNLTREIDRRLNVVAHTYDARNRRVSTTQHLTRVTAPARQVTTRFAYDAVGNLVEERLPNGNVVTHVYDGLDRKLRSEDSMGLLQAATYDARGNALTTTDANGNVTTTVFDALDRPDRIELPEDRVTDLTFDVAGNRIAETNPRGHTTTSTYDRLNRLVTVTDPAPFGYRRQMAYDAAGNLVAETNRRGHTTTLEYDGLDRLVKQVAPPPLSYETSFTYDRVGNRLSETDPREITTETRYDLENRPILVRRAGQTVQEIEYDAEGNHRFVTDANGNVTGFEYDERDLLVAENLPLAAITRHTLDDMGDRVATRDPEGRESSFGYDLRRRLTTETDPSDAVTTHAYDGNGNRTGLVRPELNHWTYRYDGADRLVDVEDPDGSVTAYTWDSNGNRLTQTDANEHARAFEYDELDRLAAAVYADASREAYTYDANGNREGLRDPKGQTIAWQYDELDRQVLQTLSLPTEPTGDDLQSIATTYDANGNVAGLDESYTGATGTRSTAKTYDTFDRVETVTDPNGERIAYAYDANGNRTRLTDPDGWVTGYTFDALNRPTAVTTAGGVTEYRYFRDGRLKEVRYPNGTTATHGYDAVGRTASIANRQGGALVSSYGYEYDENGNRIRQLETNGGPEEETTYGYDDLDRLTEIEYPDRTVSYGYDAVGNRKTEQARNAAGVLVADKLFDYDERDRLTSLTDRLDAAASVSYGYDANGNQISRAVGEVTTGFRFDVRDQLIEVRRAGELLGFFQYDYHGLRVGKRSGTGDTVRYVYDDQSVLLQTDLIGQTIARYAYGPDRLLSLDHAAEGRQFYLFDALGSPVDLVGTDGDIRLRAKYDALGRRQRTGRRELEPLRLHRARAR